MTIMLENNQVFDRVWQPTQIQKLKNKKHHTWKAKQNLDTDVLDMFNANKHIQSVCKLLAMSMSFMLFDL